MEGQARRPDRHFSLPLLELYDGQEGFDFLGCHLHKRMSGKLWEQKRRRLYLLQRWPSARTT